MYISESNFQINIHGMQVILLSEMIYIQYVVRNLLEYKEY